MVAIRQMRRIRPARPTNMGRVDVSAGSLPELSSRGRSRRVSWLGDQGWRWLTTMRSARSREMCWMLVPRLLSTPMSSARAGAARRRREAPSDV